MNYGVISVVVADQTEEYQKYVCRFDKVGITADRIIVAICLKEVVEQLKPGDMLVILPPMRLCSRINEVLDMMEQLLSKGITLCFCSHGTCIIRPEELPVLRVVMKQAYRKDMGRSSSEVLLHA